MHCLAVVPGRRVWSALAAAAQAAARFSFPVAFVCLPLRTSANRTSLCADFHTMSSDDVGLAARQIVENAFLFLPLVHGEQTDFAGTIFGDHHRAVTWRRYRTNVRITIAQAIVVCTGCFLSGRFAVLAVLFGLTWVTWAISPALAARIFPNKEPEGEADGQHRCHHHNHHSIRHHIHHSHHRHHLHHTPVNR